MTRHITTDRREMSEHETQRFDQKMDLQMLYLIRHTKPDIAPGICYGQLDIGVSDSFVEETRAVLNYLPSLDLIITSPLLRTRKLAEYLAQELQCELQTDARLMEKSFGAWEGQAWDDIARCEINEWASEVMSYSPLGGESAQQVMQRVQTFLHDMAQLPDGHGKVTFHDGKTTIPAPLSPDSLPPTVERGKESLREIGANQNIALVAHGGSIRAILAQLACVPLEYTLNWKIDYGTVIAVKSCRTTNA
jgi:alpha-ribazole phosphatase